MKLNVNEELQKAYMMLANSKQYLNNVGEFWILKEEDIKNINKEIFNIQTKVYELIHYFDVEEEE